MQKLSYKEVQDNHKEAWEGLDSSYQGDSCLKFFLDVNGNLCAESDYGGEWVWNGGWWSVDL